MAGSDPLAADQAALGAARAMAAREDSVEITVVSNSPEPGLRTLTATEVLGGAEVSRVRGSRLSSVRVATRDVRDGRSDIFLATGPAGPALAAAMFSFGLLQGAGGPLLVWIIETDSAPLVLVGSTVDPVDPVDPVAALLGEVVARALLGIAAPRVQPLASTWPGSGSAAALVTGSAEADVLVADQPTAVALVQLLAASGRRTPPALVLGLRHLALLDVVEAPGDRTGDRLALAVRAVRSGLQTAVADALATLVAARRDAAGLPPAGGAAGTVASGKPGSPIGADSEG